MGRPSPVRDGVGQQEAARRRQPPPVAGGVRVPRAADDGGDDQRRVEQPDRGRLARAGQAPLLLQRVRLDPPLPAGPVVPGPHREGVSVLENVRPELPGQEMQERSAVRERSVRASAWQSRG